MGNGLYIGKKIVSIFLMLDALAVLAGSVIYSLISFNIISVSTTDLEQALGTFNLTFLSGALVMIGGFACLILSIISIILSAVAHVKRPNVVLGIAAVLLAVVSFFMIPLSSLSNAISFALSFYSLMTSPLYTVGAQYFGLGSALFSIIILIIAIVDLVKTGRGE